MSGRETWPETVHSALRDLASWLDEADKLIDQLAQARMLPRPNSGDEVQRDLRALADWFTAHPEAATDAWAHVRDGARVTSPARGGPDTAGVDPAEIHRQRSLGWPDFHPEDYCHHCGRPNPCWFADTAEWQTATGSTGDGGGILCPSCFCALWEQVTGKTAIIWRLSIDPRSRDAQGPDTAGMREAS